ncbi:MAG: ATP-dependent zinc metalloprotease FtsH [Clostridia bacterium]
MKAKTIISIILVVAVIIGVAVVLDKLSKNGVDIDYYELMNKKLPNGEIKQIYFDGYFKVRVRFTTGSKTSETNFPTYYDAIISVPSREQFHSDFLIAKNMQQAAIDKGEIIEITSDKFTRISDIKVKYSDPSTTNVWDYVMYGIMILGVVILAVFMLKQISKQNNQGVQFSRSKARVNENVKVRFSDVAGCDEEKEEMVEIIDFLKAPKRYSNIGARIPRGVLLIGPPGTGKTLLAKAVAGEAGVPFFSISGSDFVEMYVGVGASRVRDLFEQAKRNMPCIVFIDEIDAVGRQRGAGMGGGHDEREQTLNQLLVQMDGFETNTGIIVMAATNRADILDPALLRPGRFDRQVYVNYPDVRGREAILKVHARNKPLAPDVNFTNIARITIGFTGADLENLLNEAAILAVRDKRKLISMDDINEGINKVTMGPAKKSRLVTASDKRITAYHESGHAIVSKSCSYNTDVHEVTIIPRGNAAGFTSFRPENDDQHVTRQQLYDSITTTLGGRVAEELILQSVTTGASADIRSITERVHKMVVEWGMSDELGPIYYGSEGEVFVGKAYQTQISYSQEVAALIDREENKLIKSAHARATQILTEKIQLLHNFAKVLLECETIDNDEVNMLMNGDSPDDVIEKIKQKQIAFDKLHEEIRKNEELMNKSDIEQNITENLKKDNEHQNKDNKNQQNDIENQKKDNDNKH